MSRPGFLPSFLQSARVSYTGVGPMAWFALARLLFVVAVAYAAALLQPLPASPLINLAAALVLAALVVFFETRLRETAVTRILGALIGCAIGLVIAHMIVGGLFWADCADRRVGVLQDMK